MHRGPRKRPFAFPLPSHAVRSPSSGVHAGRFFPRPKLATLGISGFDFVAVSGAVSWIPTAGTKSMACRLRIQSPVVGGPGGRGRRMRAVAGAILLMAGAVVASAQDRAPFETLSGVGDVVVTSAHEGLSDATIRERVVRQLAKHGLFTEGAPQPAARLAVDVSVSRETSNQLPCSYLVYEVRLSLEESVVLERAPERPFYATTWTSSSRLSGFVRELPAQAVSDHIDTLLGDFIRAVQSARGKLPREMP
jgi:hypothetical protein